MGSRVLVSIDMVDGHAVSQFEAQVMYTFGAVGGFVESITVTACSLSHQCSISAEGMSKISTCLRHRNIPSNTTPWIML